MSNLRRFCCDDETGEVVTYYVNDETGEPSLENLSPSITYTCMDHNGKAKKYSKFPRGFMSKTKKFKLLKANIMAGSNITSHRMLLIPTLMIFPAFFCAFLMILEVYLHVRCHKKNKTLKNSNLYYRSPFHVITSIFCGVCRDCDTASKIGQLQDKRRVQYAYFNRIAI